MDKDTALELALEALETLMIERGSIYDTAIDAVKQALGAPVQEPKKGSYEYVFGHLDMTPDELGNYMIELQEKAEHQQTLLKH